MTTSNTAATIQALIAANGDTTHDGIQYALTKMAYIAGTDDNPHYTAMAIRADAQPDADGWVPAYSIRWEISNPDAEEECDACDWAHADHVDYRGAYHLPIGRHA